MIAPAEPIMLFLDLAMKPLTNLMNIFPNRCFLILLTFIVNYLQTILFPSPKLKNRPLLNNTKPVYYPAFSNNYWYNKYYP